MNFAEVQAAIKKEFPGTVFRIVGGVSPLLTNSRLAAVNCEIPIMDWKPIQFQLIFSDGEITKAEIINLLSTVRVEYRGIIEIMEEQQKRKQKRESEQKEEKSDVKKRKRRKHRIFGLRF